MYLFTIICIHDIWVMAGKEEIMDRNICFGDFGADGSDGSVSAAEAEQTGAFNRKCGNESKF